MNNEISLWAVLLVDGAHCVEHHGEPTDCLQEVCFRSEPIKTQIDLRFPPVDIYTYHDGALTSPQRQRPLTQPEKHNTAINTASREKLKITALHGSDSAFYCLFIGFHSHLADCVCVPASEHDTGLWERVVLKAFSVSQIIFTATLNSSVFYPLSAIQGETAFPATLICTELLCSQRQFWATLTDNLFLFEAT